MYFINSSSSWYHWAVHISAIRRYCYSLCLIVLLFGLYWYGSQLLENNIQQMQQLITGLRSKQQHLETFKAQTHYLVHHIDALRSSIKQLSNSINAQDNFSCIITAINQAGLELVSIDYPQGACVHAGQSTQEISCNIMGTMQQLATFFDVLHATENAIAYDHMQLTMQGTQWHCQLHVQSVISCKDLIQLKTTKKI